MSRTQVTDDGRAPRDAAGLRLTDHVLAGTAALWPSVRQGAVVHAAAHLPGNAGCEPGARALDHFRKVARSYRPGLFHAADMAGLPRADNGPEQLFGSQRYHERHATGRKSASPSAVLRGSVRMIAGLGTRAQIGSASDLGQVDPARWRDLRRSLDKRRQARTARTRLRHDPDAYLAALESQDRQQTLPS